MTWCRAGALGVVVLGSTVVNGPATGQAVDSVSRAESRKPFCCVRAHVGTALAELLALEVVPWYFNRHVADDSTAVLSFSSWGRNVRLGFEWDPNDLKTNMFAHPYHGNLFFNAARASGYDYWGASAFAFLGSFVWEMFGENNRPAINDWAMTSLGGITIGEVLHRTAVMVRDNEVVGPGRTFSELAALAIDPVGSFNRIVRGEASRRGPNPVDRFPSEVTSAATLGFRVVGDGRLATAGTATPYGDLVIQYGDPLEDYSRPFDAFRFSLQVNGSEKQTLARLQVEGSLFGKQLARSRRARHVFVVQQIYDYMNNRTYEVGGQSLGFSLLSRFRLSDAVSVRTTLQPSVAIITGIISEYATVTGRTYDFGSGLGLRARGTLRHKGTEVLTLGYAGIYSHTLNGAPGNQVVHFVLANVRYRLWNRLGVGVDYVLFLRNSFYRDFPDVHQRNPELRIGAALLR